MRHRRTSMFVETRVLWGDATFFALFACGRLSWLLLGWILAPAGAVYVFPGWILCPLGLHFEYFVPLWVEPEAPGARHRNKNWKKHENETTWQLNWEPFGTFFFCDRCLPKSSRQAFCCTLLPVFFRERFSQCFEAGF